MNKLNQWLTLSANLGVLVGIGFLIIQIQQSNTLMRATAFQERSADLIQINSMVAESEVLLFALSKLNLPNTLCLAEQAPLDELSEQELTALKHYIMAHIFRLQNLDEQFLYGLIKPEHHSAALRALRRYLPWAQRLNLSEANIAKAILASQELSIADPVCDHSDDA
jgi:hypothetical protein